MNASNLAPTEGSAEDVVEAGVVVDISAIVRAARPSPRTR